MGCIPSECLSQRCDFVEYLNFWTNIHGLAPVKQIVAIDQPRTLLVGAVVTAVPS